MFRIFSSNFACRDIVFNQTRGIRVRAPRAKPTLYDLELRDYRRQLHQYRVKNIKEYEERQSIIENKFIDDFNKQQQEKYKNDLTRFRGNIIKISNATQNHIDFLKERERNREQIKRKWLLEEDLKRLNRQRMIKMMNIDSKDWYVLDRIESQMKDHMLIPDFVYSESDYYLKLQEQAHYYERGEYDQFEQAADDKDVIRYKNEKLVPLYQRMISIMKYMQETQEQKLMKEFDYSKALALQQEGLSNAEKLEKVKQLKKIYYGLLIKLKEEIKQPKNQIDILSRQLILLYNLIQNWKEYIFFAKMSNLMVKMYQKGEKERAEFLQKGDKGEGVNVKKAKEEAKTFEEAQTSASERYTTQTEDESDLDEKYMNLPKQDLQKKIQTMGQSRGYTSSDTPFQDSLSSESQEQTTTHASSARVDQIMKQIESNIDNVEALFEEEYEKIKEDLGESFYESKQNKQQIDVNEYIKSKEFESKIPRILIESMVDFSVPKLEVQTIKEIKEKERISRSKGEITEQLQFQLKSTVIVEVFKRKLESLSQGADLSRKEKNRLNDLKDLLNIIGEKSIDEPRMLMKIVQTYNRPLEEAEENILFEEQIF